MQADNTNALAPSHQQIGSEFSGAGITASRAVLPVDRDEVVGPEEPEDGQVKRVVDVEEPLHERVERAVAAALTVVQHQDRDGQHHAELHGGVQQVVRHERVPEDAHVEDQPQRLFPQASAVRPEAQHQQRRHAAPVPGEAHQADQADQDRFHRAGFDPVAVRHAEHHQPPRQSPDHARLALVAVVQRHKPAPVGESEPLVHVGDVGNDGKEEHPRRVFIHVPRVEEPLRHEITHRRHRDPADHVHHERDPFVRTARVDRPRDVVDGHGDDRDELDRVAVQDFVIRHARRSLCSEGLFTPPVTPPNHAC